MSEPGDVLDLAPLGVRLEFERTAAQTNGELLEFVVAGAPRGFLAQPHVHTGQAECFEVLSGELEIRTGGRSHRLGPGQRFEVPAGTPHISARRTRKASVRPAGRTCIPVAEVRRRGRCRRWSRRRERP